MKESKTRVTYNGYFYILSPNHPKATEKRPYVAEHTLIMEKSINRFLEDDEVVHHIDFNRKNNLIENLQLMTRIEHARYHGSLKVKKMIEVKCSNCGIVFEIELAQYNGRIKKGYLNFYCNRVCMGKVQGKNNNKIKRSKRKPPSLETKKLISLRMKEYWNNKNSM